MGLRNSVYTIHVSMFKMLTPVDPSQTIQTETRQLHQLMTTMNTLVHMQDEQLVDVDLSIHTTQQNTQKTTQTLSHASSLRRHTSALVLGVVGMATLGPLGAIIAGKVGALGGLGLGGLLGVCRWRRHRFRKKRC